MGASTSTCEKQGPLHQVPRTYNIDTKVLIYSFTQYEYVVWNPAFYVPHEDQLQEWLSGEGDLLATTSKLQN